MLCVEVWRQAVPALCPGGTGQGMLLQAVGVRWASLQPIPLLPLSHISYIWAQALRTFFFFFLFTPKLTLGERASWEHGRGKYVCIFLLAYLFFSQSTLNKGAYRI